jgi:PAS domain S-box-containing protein
MKRIIEFIFSFKFFSLYLLLIFSDFGYCQQTVDGLSFITNYKPREYKAHIQNWDIEQDNRGVIYVANVDGLLEFDGQDWKLYPLPENTTGRSLDIDDEGRIYLGSSKSFGYFKPDKRGHLTFHDLNKKFNANKDIDDVWNTTVYEDLVFFRTYHKLYIYNGDTVTVFNAKKDSRFLNDFVYKGDYFIIDISGTIYKYEDRKFVRSEELSALTSFSPFTVTENEEENLLFISRDSLYYFSDNEVSSVDDKLNSFLGKTGTYYGLNSLNKKIAVGTDTEGLVIYDKKKKSYSVINDKTGLQGETVYEILKDRENNLWLALSNGISRIEVSSPISYWSKVNGLNAFVTDIVEFKGTIYFTTENGIFYLDQEANIKELENLNEQSWNLHVFNNPYSGEKELLVGTNVGLMQVKDNQLITHYTKPTEVVTNIFSTTEFPDLLFLGLTDGLSVLRYNGKKWNEIDYVSDLGYDVRSIVRDKNGIFWLGTFRGGVIKAKFNEESNEFTIIKNYKTKHGLPTLKNLNVFNYSNRFIVGSEKGIYKYEAINDTFLLDSTFGEPFINGKNGVFTFEEGENNEVYLTGLNNRDNKIGYGKKNQAGGFDWTFGPFERLPDMMILSIYIQSDSIIWIGGSKGLYKYEKKDYDYGKNLQTYIRHVTINDDSTVFFGNMPYQQRTTGHQNLENQSPVGYDYNTFSFSFSFPYYDGKYENKYQYFLEGFDEDWSEWSSSNYKQYTNLPEGDYIFHVRGKNIYGEIGNKASYIFSIEPPWYRSTGAYIGYLLLLVLIIWIILRIYTHNLKASNIRLEQKVRERTHEIEQQKEEIEQQRDSIYNQAKQLELINNELKKLSIAASETDNAILLMDKNGNLEWINEGFTRLYGYNIEEVREKFGTNLILNNKDLKLSEFFEKVKRNKTSYIYESPFKAKNGEIIISQTTLTPIMDQAGNITRLVAIDSDIRKLKEVEDELKKLNATKDKFFSIIAHDLKNPFHSILGGTKVLIKKVYEFDKDRILFYLQNMEDVAQRGYDLLDNLLEWSRSQTGRLDFAEEELPINDLVKSSIDLLKVNAENKEVRIINEVNENTKVLADRNTIATVLRNLISNAIKYTHKGDEIRVYSQEKNNHCYLYIADTGLGISPENQEKLFEIDKNFSTKGTGDEKGTGLGLILCKEFVERNGGEISVESEPGVGTTFSFYLRKK